jgi:hypothetical protein
MNTILGSKLKDQWLIIYSSFAGFLLVAFYLGLKHVLGLEEIYSFLITFGIFAVFFDVRHFFPTYARTLLDQHFMGLNKRWFYLSWALIIILPIILYLIISSGEYQVFNSFLAVSFLLRATYVLGFYHLVKQNWGFMAIYKKKHGEVEDGSDRWEKLLLLSGAYIPFVILSMTSPVWFAGDEFAFTPQADQLSYVIAIWKKIGGVCLVSGLFFLAIGFLFNAKPQYKYVSRNLGWFMVFSFLLINLILRFGQVPVLGIILILLIALFIFSLYKAIRRERMQQFVNWNKWQVLFSSLILYGVVFMLPVDNKFILAMAVTIPHDIQYLSFTREFGQKYYSSSRFKHGLAASLAKRTALFFLISLVYALIFESARTGVKFLPADPMNPQLDFYRNMVSVFFIGMVLHHYYLDAVIWRVRKDEDLKKGL